MSGSAQSRMAVKRHETLAEIEDMVARFWLEMGGDSAAATLVAEQFVDEFAKHFGGQLVCWPTDYRRKLSLRELEIYEKFDGRNHTELAAAYGMTERGMYKLIARVRVRVQDANRGSLFEADFERPGG